MKKKGNEETILRNWNTSEKKMVAGVGDPHERA